MIRLLADENFNNDIVSGLLRLQPDIDIERVQDVGLRQARDEAVLEWAASQGRVILTHDANTLIGLAYGRIKAGLPMAGVLAVRESLREGEAIDELLVFCLCSRENEWAGQGRSNRGWSCRGR